MKLRSTAVLFALAVTSCNVTDEAVVDDATPQAAAEPAAVARPTGLMEFDEQVRTAIEALPDDNGWPDAAEFDALASTPIKPYRLATCGAATLRIKRKSHEIGPVLLGEIDGQWAMLAHADQSDQQWTLNQSWDSPEFDESNPVFTKDDAKLECHQPAVETVRATAGPFSTFVYSAILTSPDEPTFVPAKITDWDDKRLEKIHKVTDWNEARIAELIELGPPAGDQAWSQALSWANGNDRLDLAYEIHRRFRPMGRCSRDTRPQHTKQTFAQVCNDISLPRCYMALSVELLGYRHSRVSDMWIGGKPVSYTSPLATLPAPVDKKLFMLGLLVDYPGTDHNENAAISPRFFALAQDGSTHTAELDATLVKWLQNPDTDAWNRHRFAVGLYFMRTWADPTTDQREHARSVAGLSGVPPVTVAQLVNVQNHKDD